MKPTVFIVCEPTYVVGDKTRIAMDLTPASEYGEINILVPYAQSLLAPVPTVRTLKEKLRHFSDQDFLLPVGDPVLMSTAAMIASEVNGGKVKFLKWDRKMRKYFVIQVDTSGRAI